MREIKTGFIFDEVTNGNACLVISFESPATHETVGSRGMSHLIEHIVCESYTDLEELFEQECITVNAYTSENNTCFYIKGTAENIQKYGLEYIKRILSAQIDEDIWEREKKIVYSEVDSAFTDERVSFWVSYSEKILKTPTTWGRLEDIEKFTHEQTVEFYNKYFRNPTKIIYTSSEFPSKELSDYCESLEYEDTCINAQGRSSDDLVLKTVTNKEAPMLHVFSQAIDPHTLEKPYLLDIISDALSNGLKSPLYREIREKNQLAYFVSSNFGVDATCELADFRILVDCKISDSSKVDALVTSIFENIEEFLTPERVTTTVNRLKNKRDYDKSVIGKGDIKFLSPVIGIFSVRDNLENVTYDEVLEVAKHFLQRDKFIFLSQAELENM